MTSWLRLFAAGLCVLVVFGCKREGSNAGSPSTGPAIPGEVGPADVDRARGAERMVLREPDGGREYSIAEGQEVLVALAENPQLHQKWGLTLLGEPSIRLADERKRTVSDVEQTRLFRFKGGSGRGRIQFSLVQEGKTLRQVAYDFVSSK